MLTLQESELHIYILESSFGRKRLFNHHFREFCPFPLGLVCPSMLLGVMDNIVEVICYLMSGFHIPIHCIRMCSKVWQDMKQKWLQ